MVRRFALLMAVVLAALLGVAGWLVWPSKTPVRQAEAMGVEPTVWDPEREAPKGVDLLADAVWEYSVDDGQTWGARPPMIPAYQTELVLGRTTFNVADPGAGNPGAGNPGAGNPGVAGLQLVHGLPPRSLWAFNLNGRRVPVPMRGMYYRIVPGIPATLLQAGKNTLTATIAYDNRTPPPEEKEVRDYELELSPRLEALAPKDLEFTTGPVLGEAGPDHFTVMLRTNMAAEVELYYGSAGAADLVAKVKPVMSEKGMFHRFRVEGLKAGQKYAYFGVARVKVGAEEATKESARGVVRTLPAADQLRFVAFGDGRSIRPDWRKVGAAVAQQAPDLVVYSGDMVSRGRDDWRWADYFFSGPPAALFATVPFYAVIGNHEEDAPVYPLLFITPTPDGLGKNWAQETNGVLLIGIDGHESFDPDTANYAWLEKTLASSKARFIFFFSHFPSWTSGIYGQVDKHGDPRSEEVKQSRLILQPLLQKYGATAFIAGHDHLYERSEVTGGKDRNGNALWPITVVISGRAGAPTRTLEPENQSPNPYSASLDVALKLSYCLFEVDGNVCTMKSLTPEGELLDSRTWSARGAVQP